MSDANGNGAVEWPVSADAVHGLHSKNSSKKNTRLVTARHEYESLLKSIIRKTSGSEDGAIPPEVKDRLPSLAGSNLKTNLAALGYATADKLEQEVEHLRQTWGAIMGADEERIQDGRDKAIRDRRDLRIRH